MFDAYMNLDDYLASKGTEKQSNGLYFSPFVDEETPSFSVWGKHNTCWSCFSSDRKGVGIVSLVEQLHNLKDIPNGTRNGKTKTVFMQVQDIVNGEYVPTNNIVRGEVKKENVETKKPTFEIKSYEKVKSKSLINYLSTRGIPTWLHSKISEIKYWNSKANMMFYSISLKNDSGGFPHRNPRFKGNIGKADITTLNLKDLKIIILNSTTHVNRIGFSKYENVKIFEGMLDFFSYCVINKGIPKGKAGAGIKELYLDNGRSGDIATYQIMKMFPRYNFIDKRHFYDDYDDLNDFLMQKRNTKEEYRISKEGEAYNIMLGGDFLHVTVKLEEAIKWIEDKRKKPNKKKK